MIEAEVYEAEVYAGKLLGSDEVIDGVRKLAAERKREAEGKNNGELNGIQNSSRAAACRSGSRRECGNR
jgi:hypothetical protein